MFHQQDGILCWKARTVQETLEGLEGAVIITRTPLRVSFFGGGTDIAGYYANNGGGAVLSATIDKCFYVFCKERFYEDIRVSYSKMEIVGRIEQLRHALVRETLRKTGITQGIEITTMSDIPSQGSGLGSSSSVTVGLLNAFYHYCGIDQPPEELAREACEIEIEILGKPIGRQDQYAAAYGGMNEIRFLPGDVVEVEPFDIDKAVRKRLNANLLLFWTGLSRSAPKVLSEQVKNIAAKSESLLKMKEMVTEGKEMLTEGRLDDFGRLLHEAWEYKKQQASQITNKIIDSIYSRGRQAGALGGKLCGAGAGGFMLLYCPKEKQAGVREALCSLRELHFSFETLGSRVIFTTSGRGYPQADKSLAFYDQVYAIN